MGEGERPLDHLPRRLALTLTGHRLALEHPWGNYGRLCVVIWPFLAKKKKKKEKIALFRFMAPPGFEPTTTKKWQKRLFHARSLVLRSEASPEKCVFGA